MFVKEFPLPLFLKFYPDYIGYLIHLKDFDTTDPDYIVRVEYLPDGTVNQFEVGYKTDKWFLTV